MIVVNQKDFEWARELKLKTKDTCIGFFQPEWERSQKVIPSIVAFVQKNPEWRISLQTHKFLNIR
jgi:7-carboxy-7-deazaguanine synthase